MPASSWLFFSVQGRLSCIFVALFSIDTVPTSSCSFLCVPKTLYLHLRGSFLCLFSEDTVAASSWFFSLRVEDTVPTSSRLFSLNAEDTVPTFSWLFYLCAEATIPMLLAPFFSVPRTLCLHLRFTLLNGHLPTSSWLFSLSVLSTLRLYLRGSYLCVPRKLCLLLR